MEDTPENALLLVDTFDTLAGVRNAIAAARETGIALKGVRLDSGDLLALSRATRVLLDDAGFADASIVASGDLEESRIAKLADAGAPVDVWGVGTELGTSRDAPALGGVYKLVADLAGGRWRPVVKRSPGKATLPGAKQVFRTVHHGLMAGDTLARADETLDGHPLLVAVMRDGVALLGDTLEDLRDRARSELAALPPALRDPRRPATAPYPVRLSTALRDLAAELG
jgi:nicotinate phosphoribosyltransferase